MALKHTYVVSVHDQDEHVLLEEVRTQRRVRVAGLLDIGEQIGRWLEQDPAAGPVSAPAEATTP